MRDFEWKSAVFFACWAVLTICSFAFFQFSKNAALKKTVLVWGHLLADVVFLGFVAWIGFPVQAFFLVIPALVVIHGNRTLSLFPEKDLRQVVFVPATAAASHGNAEFIGNLFE